MPKKNSLGKGLGAIFSDLLDDTPDRPQFIMCGIEELTPNRFQPRKTFDGEEQRSLIASIKHSGIIQPIVVRKADSGYEIIAGERRWRAAQAAHLKNVPIFIKEASDAEVAELSLIENIQREDLNPIEEAEAYQTLMNTFSLSQEDISERVGKNRSTIANALRLLKLPRTIKDALVDKTLSAGHARTLLALESAELQNKAFIEIKKKNLSVRETEKLVNRLKSTPVPDRKAVKSVEVVSLENQLSTKFMTMVNINQSKRGGTIQIKFRSADELNRLLNLIL